MVAPARFGYMTNNIANLRKARELAVLAGYVVDLLPPDAPIPAPGAYAGIMADFTPNAPHDLARRMFLEKLIRLTKVFPVVVYDHQLELAEVGALRAAGIKHFPSVRGSAFAALLAHPLAAKKTAPVQPANEPDRAPDAADVAEDVPSTVG